MGNHSIDCSFCGQDRRLVGPNCCKARIESEAKREAAHRAAADADTAYLKRFGLETRMDALGHCTKLDAKDVVQLLKSFEDGSRKVDGSGVLVETSRSFRL